MNYRDICLESYLLGGLPEAAQAALETRYFNEDAYFERLLGVEEGLSMFNKARKLNGAAPLSLNPDKFYRSFFVSDKFTEMLRVWHWEKIQHWSKPEIIAQEITDDLEAALEQFATIAEDLQ